VRDSLPADALHSGSVEARFPDQRCSDVPDYCSDSRYSVVLQRRVAAGCRLRLTLQALHRHRAEQRALALLLLAAFHDLQPPATGDLGVRFAGVVSARVSCRHGVGARPLPAGELDERQHHQAR
jgi:hypothetical protein